MRIYITAVFVLAGLLAGVSPTQAEEPPTPTTVVRFALDDSRTTPYVVLTCPNEATAIEMPYEIEDWGGRGFTPDTTKVGGDFLLRFVDKICFVSPLAADANRTLHLVMRGHSYPIELRPAASAYAFRKVVFFDPAEELAQMERAAERSQRKVGNASGPAVQRLQSAPRLQMAPASDEMQLGLIRFMQMLCTMTDRQAAKAVAANPALSWSRRDNESPIDAGDFRLKPKFLIRNETMKSIGVAVEVENRTRRRLTFLSDSFVMRSGKAIYPQTAVDFNPVVEPGASNMAFIVIGRTPDGSPMLLAPDTPMQLSIALASSASVKPAAAVSLLNILSDKEVTP